MLKYWVPHIHTRIISSSPTSTMLQRKSRYHCHSVVSPNSDTKKAELLHVLTLGASGFCWPKKSSVITRFMALPSSSLNSHPSFWHMERAKSEHVLVQVKAVVQHTGQMKLDVDEQSTSAANKLALAWLRLLLTSHCRWGQKVLLQNQEWPKPSALYS